MASPAAHRKYTIGECVRREGYSNVRHEYLEGQIYLESLACALAVDEIYRDPLGPR
jgi:hypothetical protein